MTFFPNNPSWIAQRPLLTYSTNFFVDIIDINHLFLVLHLAVTSSLNIRLLMKDCPRNRNNGKRRSHKNLPLNTKSKIKPKIRMQGISALYPSQNVFGYALYCIQINYIAKMHYGYLDSCCITTYLHSFMRHRAKSSKYVRMCQTKVFWTVIR